MHIMNFVSPLVNAFLSFFSAFFAGQTKPTMKKLILLIAAMTLTGSLSIRKCHAHVIRHLSGKSLESFYYMLSDEGRSISIDKIMDEIVRLALSAIPKTAEHLPIIIIGDDTNVPKAGKDMGCMKLYDHSGYHQTQQYRGKKDKNNKYFMGHNFLTTIMCVPAEIKGKIAYHSAVTGHRMYTGKESKLVMLAQMVRQHLQILGEDRKVLLMCDSWYPKGAVAKLADIPNLEIVCNARIDSVMWEPEPKQRTGHRGRPPKKGQRVFAKDFELTPVPETNMHIGTKLVKTNLWPDKTVLALVTQIGDNGSRRLFFCTDPAACDVFHSQPSLLPEGDAQVIAAAAPRFAMYGGYRNRWGVETVYFQLKAFWDFTEYKLRREVRTSRLLNIQAALFSVLSLLPALDERFADLAEMSIQERRWHIGHLISREIFFQEFRQRSQTGQNSQLLQALHDILASGKDLAA